MGPGARSRRRGTASGGRALRAAALLVPAAGAVLCLMANNHGAGLLVGGALGALLTVIRPHALRVPAEPVPASGAVR